MDQQANTTLHFDLDPVELESQRKPVYFNLVEKIPSAIRVRLPIPGLTVR